MDFVQNTCNNGICKKGCCRSNKKLNTYDWLCDITDSGQATDFVEVQFKNTRKGYYLNDTKISLKKGDIVAVEASPGHDIGTVSLTGKLVFLQMRKSNVRDNSDVKRIYRIAKPVDMERYKEAKSLEYRTMLRARQIAGELRVAMKIGDVEYQGDGSKAIFYYIADERVDFRQLIKHLAEIFRVRIEMKQIGSRQEAGRIGGIGPCGRELCCSSWMTGFVSVATDAARFQDISMNPQKLAGQCAKLKCCFNYEVDAYVEAQKEMPPRKIPLETKERTYYHFKTDVFKKTITYSTDREYGMNLVTISSERVFEVISLNKKGIKPKELESAHIIRESREEADSHDILGDSVSRFDPAMKRNKKRHPGNRDQNNNGQSAQSNERQRRPHDVRSNNRPHPRNNKPRTNDATGGQQQV
jgi:cell fate regulator YaaT (PSP1 superfamily)